MEPQFSYDPPAILHELDLGQHTLFLFSDGSLDLLSNDEQTPYLAENMMHLESEETYHLFVALQEQFRQEEHASQKADGGGETRAY